MSMNSSPDWPTELGAGQPLVRLPLASTSESTDVRRELLVYREDEGARTMRIVEIISSDSGAQPSREIVHFLDLTQDGVLPLYTIASHPRAEWNMEIVYRKGSSPAVYLLREREDVFRLQRIFTGYEPVGYFENVTCSVIFKSKGIPMLGRDSQYKGCGEIQLWWPEIEPSSPMPPVSPTSSRSSQYGISVQSTNPEHVRPMSVGSVQRNFNRGRELVVSVLTPPPLLVAFLRDDFGYTMLKTHIINIEGGVPQDGQINLQGRKTRTFIVNKQSVKRCQLKSWNLCAIGTKASGIESLKCTYLTLKFENLAILREFDEKLMLLQARWLELETKRLAFIGALRAGNLPLSAVVDSATDSESVSASTQPARTLSLPPPIIPELEFEPLLPSELDIERQPRELSGIPVVDPFELNNRDNGDEGGDRTYWGYRRSV